MLNPFEALQKKGAVSFVTEAALTTPEKHDVGAGGHGSSPLSPWAGREHLEGSSFRTPAPSPCQTTEQASGSVSTSLSSTEIDFSAELQSSVWTPQQEGPDLQQHYLRQRHNKASPSRTVTPNLEPVFRAAQDTWAADTRKPPLSSAISLQPPPSDYSYSNAFPSIRQPYSSWSGHTGDDSTAQVYPSFSTPANSLLSLPEYGFLQPQQDAATYSLASYSTAGSSMGAGTSTSGSTYMPTRVSSAQAHVLTEHVMPHEYASMAHSHNPFGSAGDESLQTFSAQLSGQFSGSAPAGIGLGHGPTSSAALTPGLTQALDQVADERGLDQGALAILLQNPLVLSMLTGGTAPLPPQLLGGYGQQPPSPLPSPRVSMQQSAHRRPSEGGRRGMAGSHTQPPSGSLSPMRSTSLQQQLPAHIMVELNNNRSVLVQLMLSAFAFLNSDSMHTFYDNLSPISLIYTAMHELPVVQKRQCCREMAALRDTLLADPAFTQMLTAVCALRQHLYSLSRKLLQLSQQSPDAVPIDLLLGSMSSELSHLLKGLLPQEVLDFFANNLPHPQLAVLVFCEFTGVDPIMA